MTLRDRSVIRVLRIGARAAVGGDGDLVSAFAAITTAIERFRGAVAMQWYVESRPARHAPSPADERGPDRAQFLVLRERAGRRDHTATARSLRHADELATVLDTLGLMPALLDGQSVTHMLLRRLRLDAAVPAPERAAELVGSWDPQADTHEDAAAADRVLEQLEMSGLSLADGRTARFGAGLEQTVCVAARPTAAGFDWLAPLLAVDRPFALAVHADRVSDDDFTLAVYQTIREPGPRPDAVRLAAAVDAVVRDFAAQGAARLDRGEFRQATLWPSTVPIAWDAARVTHRVSARAVAESLPIVHAECGSPAGMPFAYGAHGSIERLDPWDHLHAQPGVAIGGAGAATIGVVRSVVAGLIELGVGVVVTDFDGSARNGLSLPGAPARVVAPADAATAFAAGGDGPLVLDGAAAEDPLALAGAGAALAAARAAGDGRGALVITGADRVLARPGGARWLRRLAAAAGRRRSCLVAAVPSLMSLAHAGVLRVLPVRVALRHEQQEAAALQRLLGLSDTEMRLVASLDGADTAGPPALWCNGRRGRAPVRVIPVAGAPA